MRLLLAAVIPFALAMPLTAQGPLPESAVNLEIDLTPPEDGDGPEGTWVPVDSGDLQDYLMNFRIRAKGTEGGWVDPVFGCDVSGDWTDAPWWLVLDPPKRARDMNWWDLCDYPFGTPNPLVLRPAAMQTFIDLALFNGYATRQTDGVRTWCQPFLTEQLGEPGHMESTRLWTANAPLWTGPGGSMHKAQWYGMLTDAIAGESDPRVTCLLAGAALRQSIILQSIAITGSDTAANDFFNSPLYKEAIQDDLLKLAVQGFAMRADGLPDEDWPTDDKVPDLGQFEPKPKVGVSIGGKWGVAWPNHSGEFIFGLGGQMVPGQDVPFAATFATPPFIVIFVGPFGSIPAEAFSDSTSTRSSQYWVTVPPIWGGGDIYCQSGLDGSPMKVGSFLVPR